MFPRTQRNIIIDQFVDTPPPIVVDAKYGVKVVPAGNTVAGKPRARCLGVYLLANVENVTPDGKRMHHIFIDVVNKDKQLIYSRYYVEWDWVGRMPHQRKPTRVEFDKSQEDGIGNITLSEGQIVSLKVADMPSDEVTGIHTDYPEEENKSWYVVFQVLDEESDNAQKPIEVKKPVEPIPPPKPLVLPTPAPRPLVAPTPAPTPIVSPTSVPPTTQDLTKK